MRRLGIALAILVTAQCAYAADPPILRGSYVEPIVRSRPLWQGFYIGGHAGYSSHDFDFSKTTTGLQQFLVRESVLAASVGEWQLLDSSNVRTSGFGGFAGYNWQWDDAVIGIEANYTHFSGKRGSSSASLSRTVANPEGSNPPAGHSYEYDVTLSGNASARVNDLLTLRARGGYAMGSFMPYAFAGLAMALVDIDRSATARIRTWDLYNETIVIGTTSGGDPITTTIPRSDLIGDSTQSKAESQKNLLTFGFSAGIGFEYMLMQNIFVRAEYEYVQLPLAKDTIIQLNTGRVGLGARF
ncbi:outer membrane beta-barrel protein [Bradyrhizobium sp. LHD-71]|uniref:outer membrane protein n=1 Tax=Bradyrhizobium sp. LHD-71 TaxID=3072141 RepID=UPI0028109187|nr:outer membrane beta-barrel protein [Bradyrhizobium sp. LHD-71]MDQ8726824.1 outer membrane beta-barrel protein [Bradyrhizobium sp. LHD-71]